MQSFEDLSKAAVVDIAPDMVDGSFVVDRLDADTDEYRELVASIRENGQDSPILVRPNPTEPGRYQAVFGHRRLKAAQELGRPVRAIVREVPDREHVIAQGQENAARLNLSFIERTMFAKQVLAQGHSAETLMAALVLDETTLSKMRSVLANIPEELVKAIGSARNIGRDRWWQFSKQVERLTEKQRSAVLDLALSTTGTGEQRFEAAMASATQHLKGKKARERANSTKTWVADDRAVSVTFRAEKKKATVTLASKDGPRFAEFITQKLGHLYEEFRGITKQVTGD